jgi:hypothetical protein
MTEPLRPDARAAAARVKDLARDLAEELAGGYRRSTRYLRLKVAVVGSWALLSAATLWAACPSSGPLDALGAEVRVQEEVIGTQILVSNASRRMWTDVAITLDGGWRYRTSTVRAGQRLVLATSKFEKDGAPAPGDLAPRTLTVECDQGAATTQLSAR